MTENMRTYLQCSCSFAVKISMLTFNKDLRNFNIKKIVFLNSLMTLITQGKLRPTKAVKFAQADVYPPPNS